MGPRRAALTVLRMAPVALILAGSGFRAPTVAYLGWFGPRGLATVIFAILAPMSSCPCAPTRRCARPSPGPPPEPAIC